ncbi:MAG: hypothetical protein U1F43_30250 [Myxococcota bacterium]
MEELEITLGQRSLASIHGEQTTASAYAGLGARHLLLVGDGGVGAVPSRLAAQVACSAALARMRASVFPELSAQIEEAFAEAHGAVRRSLVGTPAADKGGASRVRVVIDSDQVVAARVGGGRVYVMRGDRLEALFREAGPGMLGQGQIYPEVAELRTPMEQGFRVVVLSESAMRATGADLYQLVHAAAPQLAATRLAEAARRRGQHDPIAVHVLEVQSDDPRPADRPHPALARIARDRPRTIDSDGTVIGTQRGPRAARASEALDPRRAQAGRDTGWLLWFFVAVALGAGAALIVHRGKPGPTIVQGPPDAGLTLVAEAPDASAAEVVAPDTSPPDEEVAAPEAPEVTAIFEAETTERLALNIRNHITRSFPSDGEAVFARLEAAVLARRKDPKVVEALVELLKEPELKRTARWVQGVLPKLVSDAPAP